MSRRAILYALLSAALFGASTPLAKALVQEVAPLTLAGLLYLGSGLGLALWRAMVRTKGEAGMPVAKQDLPWLAAAIACGGVAGPALLMYGLQRTDGSTASLLLNLEAVFTALLAWVVFRENVDRRVFLGMAAIVAGGAILSAGELSAGSGALFIGGACLCWALDNNLTRRVSGGDAVVLAALKGLVAGPVNLALAWSQGAHLPALPLAGAVLLLGLAGYGISLVLFIRALRNLGTARTGAYFSVAPFFGAALALLLLGEQPGAAFWAAASLMALGVWLHISERHEHEHVHEPLFHEHEHLHDEHHRHEHASASAAREPHTHPHRHEALRHRHPHYPDLHHRHGH
ncbi:MAG TPA: DMT family transporter [Burkholderiales bacterium]|jgi:drug/metabolite transporter (DMT)-like permease